MAPLLSEALTLLRSLKEALEEEPFISASKEDLAYFRSRSRHPLHHSAAHEKPPSPPVIGKTIQETPRKNRELDKKPLQPSPPERAPLAERHSADGKDKSDSPGSFSPSALQPRPIDSFEDLKLLIAKAAPQIRLVQEIPSDEKARQAAERWKTLNQAARFSLLVYQEPELHRKLLANLAQALDLAFGDAKLIQCASLERGKQWEAFLSAPELKHILVCDSTLFQLPQLLQFYREVPSQSERFLSHTPLFLLPDLSLYLKDPLLKRSLWKALCHKFG